jgi:predicted CoA-binding protein
MTTKNPINAMLERRKWAIVGASDKPDRYSYKIFRLLRGRGYTVYPIHPKLPEVEGVPCHASLSDLPEKPDVINLVVNPSVGIEVVAEAAKLGVDLIWAQPGAQSAEIDQAAEKAGIQMVNDCVLVELAARPELVFA